MPKAKKHVKKRKESPRSALANKPAPAGTSHEGHSHPEIGGKAPEHLEHSDHAPAHAHEASHGPVQSAAPTEVSAPSKNANLLIGGLIVLVLLAGGWLALTNLPKPVDNPPAPDTNASGPVFSLAPEKDPVSVLTIVTSEKCRLCDTNLMETTLLGLFPKTKIKRVTMEDAEGKALVDRYKPVALPAFVYDQNIYYSFNYSTLKPYVLSTDGGYFLDPVRTEPAYFFEIPPVGDSPFKGPADANVTLIEFSDFECDFCAKSFQGTLDQLTIKYQRKVRYVFKHYPLKSHIHAVDAAEVAECAQDDNNKFWLMHDSLFATQLEWNRFGDEAGTFQRLAANLVIDLNKFNECLQSDRKVPRIEADRSLGDQFNVDRKVPFFFLNHHFFVGVKDTNFLTDLIEAELAQPT